MLKRKKNRRYNLSHPDIELPPDYFLYETYHLDYEEYIRDGEESAKEIIQWTEKFFKKSPGCVLEWGCGVSRITRHIHKFIDAGSSIYACDINPLMIEWNSKYITQISFTTINHEPPTHYEGEKFDLVFAVSVLTHIDTNNQENWLKEINRILKPGGIFLFTTHGKNYFSQLLLKEAKELEKSGAYTRNYFTRGHRMVTTYNKPEPFNILLGKYFEVMEFHDGSIDKSRTGGQDLWIVRKK
jgi:SAM-dependent methyltransferase